MNYREYSTIGFKKMNKNQWIIRSWNTSMCVNKQSNRSRNIYYKHMLSYMQNYKTSSLQEK